MRFVSDRAVLLKALSHIQNVVEKRVTIPILTNVLLSVKGGILTIVGTDLELGLTETVAIESGEDGTTTVSAFTLFEIVRRQSAGQIELSHRGGDEPLALRCGRYSTKLVVLPPSDFPDIKAGKFSHTFSVPAADLLGLFETTRFAISTEETRYYLNGVFMHVVDGSDGVPCLRGVATDGHRLARADCELPEGAAGMPGIIVPRKTVGEFTKLADGINDTISVSVSETRILFDFGAVKLTSKLIDGTYPDYSKVIPRNNQKLLVVDKGQMSGVVGRVSAITSEKNKPLKLTCTPGGLLVSATSPETGTASEEVDPSCMKYDAESINVGFQARYLSDVLGQVGETVEFHMADPASPVLLRSGGNDRVLFVLMPLRVD